MDARKFPRFAVQCPIAFSGDHIVGEGTVKNLSKNGWKVDLAVVRWSTGQEFGLEFISMETTEWKRIRQFVKTLEPREISC